MPPLTLKELEQKVLSNPSNTNLNNWWNAAIEAQLICFEAQNEQNPIGDLLKCSVRPMQLKSESKHQQVGDYVFKIKNTWCRIVFERKSVPDLYSTLFMTSANGEKNRDRLKREIQRFYDDTRFNRPFIQFPNGDYSDVVVGSFIIICEGTYQEYLNYLAPRKACKYCNHWTENVGIEMKKGVGICNKTTRYPPITNAKEECWQFSEKEDIGKRISKLLNAKKASIDSLNSMPQVQVLFCESREDMAERIESIVKLWCFHNFEEILQSMG
jgi:hypothetical protein